MADKNHWENIYTTKQPNQVSWTQVVPKTSLEYIFKSRLGKYSKIIDIGGGDSLLADHLLNAGFRDITVLDISEAALQRAKSRLGERAGLIKWVQTDIVEFQPSEIYEFWHDRATFHFLTDQEDRKKYINIAKEAVRDKLFIGTFSESSPDQCSGLQIQKYSEDSLCRELCDHFEKIECVKEDHHTPFNTVQNFLFCQFNSK